MPLLLIFAFPLAEIATFLAVGHAIGVFATLSLVVASSVLGLVLLRDGGQLTMARLRRGSDSPQTALVEGGTRMAAGILLLIPGFLTDLAAIALLVPGLRQSLLGWAGVQRPRPPRGSDIIEGDFRRLDS